MDQYETDRQHAILRLINGDHGHKTSSDLYKAIYDAGAAYSKAEIEHLEGLVEAFSNDLASTMREMEKLIP